MYNKFDFVEASICLVSSTAAMTMACIYHFHEYGFFLGFLGFVISCIWMFIMIRDNIKEGRFERRQGPYRNENSEIEMRNRHSRSSNNSRDNSINMQEAEAEECNC